MLIHLACGLLFAFFVQVLTNDENLLLLKDKITELLNITEWQKKYNTNCWEHCKLTTKKMGALKSINYRKTYFAILLSFIVYFKIGLISTFKDKTFLLLFHWEQAPINRNTTVICITITSLALEKLGIWFYLNEGFGLCRPQQYFCLKIL